MSGNVILLEFNELSPTLMNRFISQGHLPNFKRFCEESSVYRQRPRSVRLTWIHGFNGSRCTPGGISRSTTSSA